MSEIIKGIQVIKMYTWEKPFAELVNRARKFVHILVLLLLRRNLMNVLFRLDMKSMFSR